MAPCVERYAGRRTVDTGSWRSSSRMASPAAARQSQRTSGRVLPCLGHPVPRRQDRSGGVLPKRAEGPRSRGPVEAGRSRRLLSLRDTAREMSRENVEIVRRIYSLLDQGDEAVWDLAPPDFVFDFSRRLIDPVVLRSREEVRAFSEREIMELWEGGRTRWEPKELIDAGDKVL